MIATVEIVLPALDAPAVINEATDRGLDAGITNTYGDHVRVTVMVQHYPTTMGEFIQWYQNVIPESLKAMRI